MREQLKIVYIVPYANMAGGIQQFALSVRESLSSSIKPTLKDWKSPLNSFQKLLVYLSPSIVSERFFRRYYLTSGGEDKELHNYNLVHYWHVSCAMTNSHSKSIITLHGNEILDGSVPPYRKRLFLERLTEATSLHANSNFTKNYIIKNYGIIPRKITVINPGINLTKFKFTKNTQNSKVIIGTLTRFMGRKNVPNVIRALKLLKEKRNLDFVFYVAGDGPEKKKIMRELKKSGIEYKYFGKISNKDKVSKFYPALDIFVLPPLETKNDVEGFGIVFLEANANGVPVVAADTGGVSDAVKPGVSGLFADPLSPEDIAEKIYTILASKKDWRNSARKWAENFSQEKTAKQFEALYKKASGSSR